MKKGENTTGNIVEDAETLVKRLRPRSPFMYNKSTEGFKYDTDKEFLEAQYQKSPIYKNPRHYLATFIRPVSLATLKSLSHAKLETCGLNACKPGAQPTQAVASFQKKDDCLERWDVKSASSDNNNRVSIFNFSSGDHDPLSTKCCTKCSSGVLNDESTFICNDNSTNCNSELRERQTFKDFMSCSEKLHNKNNSEVVSTKPCIINPLSYNLQKHIASNQKFITNSASSTAMKRITLQDKVTELLTNSTTDFITVEKANFSVRDKIKSVDNMQNYSSVYKADCINHNPGLSENTRIFQSCFNSSTIYKNIKEDLKAFRKVGKQFKINETSNQSIERFTNFGSKNDSGVLKVSDSGNIYYAISIRRPHSVMILRNRGSYENSHSSNKGFSEIYKHSTVKSISDNIPNELLNGNESKNGTDIMQMSEEQNNKQNLLFCSKDSFTMYSTTKQVEVDSGNGTDEDDQIFKESISPKNNLLIQETNDNATSSYLVDLLNVNKQTETIPASSQQVKLQKCLLIWNSNVELCMSSRLSNLKLSTFSTKTEKHSTLNIVAYDPNTDIKNIISAGKSTIPKDCLKKNNENLSISQSVRTSEHQNISTEKIPKVSESTEFRNSDENCQMNSVNDLHDSPSVNPNSKKMKMMPKIAISNRYAQFNKKSHPALIDSLFPYVPPVLRFVEEGQKLDPLPWEFRRLLKWRASSLTPIVVKQTLQRTGFKPSKLTNASEDLETVESSDWIFYFGKHIRPQVFQTIKMYQKVNHLPCSFQLGRKDRLWRNIVQMQLKYGKEHFSFMPQTYCLPGDLDELKKVWDEEEENQRWIMKPPASARGIGVRLVTKWSQIPKKRPALIQKYLSRPYLINDSKFDLRIYVYISSVNPLRLYIHEDGLVRFASQKYSNAVRTLSNRYIHLTNYSINRLNSEYISNTNEFAAKGISPTPIWSNIKDLVVKTVISTEAAFNTAVNTYCNHSISVHEIFGGVIKDMLNLSGLHLPEAMESSCRTIPSSYSFKYESNTPDLTMDQNANSCHVGQNISTMPVKNSLVKNDDCSICYTKSASFMNNLKTRKTKSNSQRPNPPSHRWLFDERLFLQSLSTDEEEKVKYFKTRAIQYGLPRVNQLTVRYSSSTPFCQHDKKNNKISNSCRSSIVHDSDTSSSFDLCTTSSDTDNEKESICSRRTSVYDASNDRRFSLNFSSSSSLSSVVSGKSAEFIAVSPLPDFKNQSNDIMKPVIKSYSASNGNLKSNASISRISSNISRTSIKQTNNHENLNKNPNLFVTSNTPSHLILRNATNEILDCITPSDVRILISMIDEFNRAGGFHCVFPPKTAGLAIKYLSFFESPRYTNLLCIAYLQKYSQDNEKGIEMLRKICEKRIHLKSSLYGDEIATEHHWKTYKKHKSILRKEMIKEKIEITPSTKNLSQN
ncbi:Tubulin polyglutamylase TTLL4 [Schistosoma japonicum]|nr:Tubulin polyglutamylase TTLL4 [Schistosoma japonicum]